MATPNEPQKETVPVALPSQPVAKPPGTKSRDTVRIQLPPRQSPNKLPLTEPSAAPKPPQVVVPPPSFASSAPSPVPSPKPATVSAPEPPPLPGSVSAVPESVSPGPKKETARVPVMPEPPAMPAPAVEMKKTQPLFAMPQITPQRPSIAVTAAAKGEENAIPMPIWWTLLGVSALILITQIWTYFS